ncbi:hypothetical protein HMPREF1544_07983 [Mucor circinelloides 1006PhL]|uniref:Uncharacterized protein n=1 Tax=Mucor circinelloides f. circinelloides (strain 1006PhL) TaxID=1220926 RepID=S2J9U5_MUCC1|nr:hypothetical protein HMPREF1544_07983 [Mucor circinelloides 1006PhL]
MIMLLNIQQLVVFLELVPFLLILGLLIVLYFPKKVRDNFEPIHFSWIVLR